MVAARARRRVPGERGDDRELERRRRAGGVSVAGRRKQGKPVGPTLAHRVEYLLARGLESLVSALPEGAADRLGGGVGRLVESLGIRRSAVEANLRIAFPDAPEEWIRETARAAYRHLGREAAAILRLSRLDPQAIVERTETRGWEDLLDALAEGNGALLVTGHYGNWEIAAATVASRGVPVAAIVKRMGNRLVDARLEELRRRLGVESIEMRDAPRQVPRVLKENGVVGIVADQDARGSGVFVPFFGRPASTHRGPALFALRLGAPVFACTARRKPGPEVRYEVYGHRVPVRRTGDLEADVLHLTGELATALEDDVRAAPEQYFWFHRRWKTAPPAEPPRGTGGTSSVTEGTSPRPG
ncbi:MAG TPA: lysophospholipid acyltransferase family protein [Longimicrobiaceae bacterium]|nr:lysophospholipid acyltransferase family protein [Longimicrobiaceae bacterium]